MPEVNMVVGGVRSTQDERPCSARGEPACPDSDSDRGEGSNHFLK